jgi:hypothetical protein
MNLIVAVENSKYLTMDLVLLLVVCWMEIAQWKIREYWEYSMLLEEF